MTDMDKSVGITTTIPSEIVYAAGLRPVDLNNRFITSDDPAKMVEDAEHAGFPRNVCSWIKGIYSAARDLDCDAISLKSTRTNMAFAFAVSTSPA